MTQQAKDLLARADEAIAADPDHMTATGEKLDWLIAQLACWPTRVDEDKTTNVRFLMLSAAATLRALSPPQDLLEALKPFAAAYDKIDGCEACEPIFTLNGEVLLIAADFLNARTALTSSQSVGVEKDDTVAISHEMFDFLMGTGTIDGIGFGYLNRKLPGTFWWRSLLATCASSSAPSTPSPPVDQDVERLVERLRGLLAMAPDRPWVAQQIIDDRYVILDADDATFANPGTPHRDGPYYTEVVAALIVEAINALPKLLDALSTSSRSRAEALEEALGGYASPDDFVRLLRDVKESCERAGLMEAGREVERAGNVIRALTNRGNQCQDQ